jgi:hypothetical protein
MDNARARRNRAGRHLASRSIASIAGTLLSFDICLPMAALLYRALRAVKSIARRRRRWRSTLRK